MANTPTPRRLAAPLTRKIPFVVADLEAKDVRVTGDFSSWSSEGIPLSKAPGGEWRTVLLLAPGRYEYRLRVDGDWRDHPQAVKRVPNPFGSQNCILTVA